MSRPGAGLEAASSPWQRKQTSVRPMRCTATMSAIGSVACVSSATTLKHIAMGASRPTTRRERSDQRAKVMMYVSR